MLTEEKAQTMSSAELHYARLDLLEVIEIQEAVVRELGSNACPKLGQYWDDLCLISGEIKRRQSC